MTLLKKGLKIRPYSMDMNKEDHIVALPKKGLKTRPYSMDMNKEDHIVTLPKKGLKTRPYNIGMEKMDLKTRPYNIGMETKDLKKLTKRLQLKILFGIKALPILKKSGKPPVGPDVTPAPIGGLNL